MKWESRRLAALEVHLWLDDRRRGALLRSALRCEEDGVMRYEFDKVSQIQPGWRWPHVDPAKEWACKGSGRIVVVEQFLDKFEKLRQMWGAPLIINSGYRSPAHNATVSETGSNGPHTTGRAVDIRIYGEHAFAVVHLALQLGFTGVGISQKGDQAKRFVHLDDLHRTDGYPRPTIWSY
jgi:zinc D-Ala-D-Ala carboxypeptidase